MRRYKGEGMLTYLYEWVKNVAFYMIIFTVFLQTVPNNTYKKYIQFFTGLILIIMLAQPILKVFSIEQEFQSFYKDAEYQQKVREIEEAAKYMEGIITETE